MAFPHSWGFPEVAQFSAFLSSFLKFVEKGYPNGLCEHASIAFIFASTIEQLSILSREQRALKKL